ncbi:Inositol monophosphatase 2 [Verticillium dahliae VDG2]|nr:Inositol monophosphatase 2 [Verticillium dahliae VDG2]
MPDIDPAALSRPAIGLTTPVLSNKSITVSAPGALKTGKTSQIIPARIDLEPLYTALKQAIGAEHWVIYKESLTQFLIGRLNQAEYAERIDPILESPGGEREHLHNQLVAAIYGNVTREMPDQGLAPWVSANDKPATNTGSKPVSGDAAERRLKGEVMQLPARDRRRIKDLVQNEFDPYDILSNDAVHRGEVARDKTGMLPVESRAASERGPLGMSDVRIALEMADNGLAQFPIVTTAICYGWREGELEHWHDYTYMPDEFDAVGRVMELADDGSGLDIVPLAGADFAGANGFGDGDAMDIDEEEMLWEGGDGKDASFLDSVLDSCLAVGS